MKNDKYENLVDKIKDYTLKKIGEVKETVQYISENLKGNGYNELNLCAESASSLNPQVYRTFELSSHSSYEDGGCGDCSDCSDKCKCGDNRRD